MRRRFIFSPIMARVRWNLANFGLMKFGKQSSCIHLLVSEVKFLWIVEFVLYVTFYWEREVGVWSNRVFGWKCYQSDASRSRGANHIYSGQAAATEPECRVTFAREPAVWKNDTKLTFPLSFSFLHPSQPHNHSFIHRHTKLFSCIHIWHHGMQDRTCKKKNNKRL